MIYTEAKLAEYPPQDEAALLLSFAAELLARRKFADTAHSGTAWGDWIGNGAETREWRMEPFVAHAANLAAVGMLTWPDWTDSIVWTVEGPGEDRGPDAAPALDWIQTFARNTRDALTYFRTCTAQGEPCRISWSFPPDPSYGRG